MNSSGDVFADFDPEFSAKPDRLEVVAGKVVATMNKPSAAQKRFNTLMARIDAEQSIARSLRRAIDAYGPVHWQALREIQEEGQRLCKQMAILLDQRIQAPSKPKGLTVRQKQQASRMLLSLCEQLAPLQDDEVQALYKRYAQVDEDDADMSEQAQRQAKALLDSYVGADFAQGREFDSPDDVLRAALEFEQIKHQAQAEKREAKRAQRKVKKGPTARELAAEQKQLEGQNALRTVFRQLASVLHPDREPDAQLRAHKTTLMSEVNAAYERKDLSALLRIQLQAEAVDVSKVAAISDARLTAMCGLLAEQVKALEMDNWRLRQSMEHEFGYSSYQPFDEAHLRAAMQEGLDYWKNDATDMRADIERVQDDKELKAWLQEQTRMRKDTLRQAQVFDLDDVLFSMMRRG